MSLVSVTNDYDISGATALQLAGSTSIDESMNDVVGWNDDFLAKFASTQRHTHMKVFTPTYFIQADYDINGEIFLVPGVSNDNTGIGDGNDDAWRMNAISVTKSSAANAVYNLPAGSQTDVQLAQAQAYNDTAAGSHYRTFNLLMDIQVDDQGLLTVNDVGFVGQSAHAFAEENVAVAQAVAWQDPDGNFDINTLTNHSGNNPNTVAANDVDTLHAPLTASNINDHYAADIETEVARFHNKNVVLDWSINFEAITAETNSNLSIWARNQGDVAQPTNDPFSTDDKIVTTGKHDYVVAFNDHTDSPVTLVSSTPVYGVLKQL
jgi:hypothetical protein